MLNTIRSGLCNLPRAVLSVYQKPGKIFLFSVFMMPAMLTAQAVTFENIADDPDSGITFVHGASSRLWPVFQKAMVNSLSVPIPIDDLRSKVPSRFTTQGYAGVAMLDFDNDGDEDIYLTAPVGNANALLSNQWSESGELRFIDVAVTAGVDASGQESTGVCYGDIDNDGDKDLFVVGLHDRHILFENQGDGTFNDISMNSGSIFRDPIFGVGCTMGDINNDGLLEIHVGHWGSKDRGDAPASCYLIRLTDNPPNQLFLNQGGGVFTDISATSGILNLVGGDIITGVHYGLTQGVVMVDYDLDGDVDILNDDDNCGFEFRGNDPKSGLDHGFIQFFNNDGQGNFTNVTLDAGLYIGDHMGLSVADFNGDGYLDLFSTGMGDYTFPLFGHRNADLGDHASRWFLGGPGGTFSDPGVGGLISTAFGWGSVAEDLDNDADTDIAYVGALPIAAYVSTDNPGMVLLNDGDANFSYKAGALGANYLERSALGLAAGDLNNDGFIDLVVASNEIFDAGAPRIPPVNQWGAALDSTASVIIFMDPLPSPAAPTSARWNESGILPGGATVEINQGESGLNWVKFRTVGTVGLVPGGQVNRDGVGAVLSFTPRSAKTAMRPVLGGAGFLSQSSQIVHFGMGKAKRGTLDILWPGGTRNRLYDVKKGALLTIPEIPCSYDAQWSGMREYKRCVRRAVKELADAGVIKKKQKGRFISSAVKAYRDSH